MDPAALTADLLRYAYDFEVIGQGLMLPVWALYRELRRDQVVVSLDGMGADELLMGYGVSLKNLLRTNGNLLRNPFRTLDPDRTLHRQFLGDASFAQILSESDPTLRLLAGVTRPARRAFRSAPTSLQVPGPKWFKPTPPIRRPSRSGASENENIPSPARRGIFFNAYFDFPVMRFSGNKRKDYRRKSDPLHDALVKAVVLRATGA